MKISEPDLKIDDLTVTVRALHVNGKQMTLAVFRQLPLFECYDIDGVLSLTGATPWGLIRYEVKDQGRLWVLLVLDGVLYRGNVEPNFISLDDAKDQLTKAGHHVRAYRNWIQANEDDRNAIKGQAGLPDFKPGELAIYEDAFEKAAMEFSIARKLNEGYLTLMKLPQLFIAV